MAGENLGVVQVGFVADTTKFSTSVKGVGDLMTKVANQAMESASKIAATGTVTDRVAALTEKSKARMEAAWKRELLAQDQAIDRQQAAARSAAMAALKTDILARSQQAEAAAAAKAAQSQERLNMMRQAGSKVMASLGAFGVVVGAGAAIEGFKSMIESTMEAGVQLGKLHQQTGIAITDLSVLKFAAAESGVEFESLTRGFKKLAVTVYDAENGSAKAAQGFNQLGISVADLRAKGDDMYAILGMISDKFQAMPDGIAKSDAAAKIFGARMGSDLIPVLNQGSAALEGFKSKAPIFSDADIANMEKMHHSVNDLAASWDRLKLVIVSASAPAGNWFMDRVSSGIQKNIKELGQLKTMYSGLYHTYMEGQLRAAGDVEGADRYASEVASQSAADDAGLDDGQGQKFRDWVAGGKTESAPGSGAAAAPGPAIPGYDSRASNMSRVQGGADALARMAADLQDAAALAQRVGAGSLTPSAMPPPLPASTDQLENPPAVLGQFDVNQMARPLPGLSGLDLFTDRINEVANQFTDLSDVLSTLTIRGLEDFNRTLMEVLTTPKSWMRGEHPWRNLGASVAESAGNSALQYGEGQLLKLLTGHNSKAKMGTRDNPMYTRDADSPAAAGGGMGGLLGKIFGGSGGGESLGIPKGLGGVFGSMASAVLPMLGFAEGGMIPSNMPVLVGENGPEILSGVGGRHVTPNSQINMGGGSVTNHIYAQGSQDPAATEAAVNRALAAYLPQIRRMATNDRIDGNRRVPPSRRM